MSPEEHAARIIEHTDLVLKLLAAQKYAEAVEVLQIIHNQAYDIQAGR
ncbi:hypothetical protein LCGC14_2823550 [marine sediment metagenome]|uniref:Uncharacterized protein n=1 Tax=marine sediment metagenome TaxID=412755 RepID=A0A0F9B7G0_9ZZZZ